MESPSVWPKRPPVLSAEQQRAREAFMMAWHEELPAKYGIIEQFNHGFVASLPIAHGCKTLEVGAGIGGHLSYEDLSKQEYTCLELRPEFCDEIRKRYPGQQVGCGSIEDTQPWDDKTFDRIVAVHVLEHLCNLPLAVKEVVRLLKDNGVFDIVIPTEGGLAYSLARKISAERLFKKRFKMDYTPIIRNEHVSTFREIEDLLKKYFDVVTSSYFPLKIPASNFNLCVGMRLRKKVRDQHAISSN